MADRRRTLEKQLYRQMKATAQAWSLLAPGDRIMVAMSGGKDSYTLLHLLRMLVPRLPFEVELVAVHLDQRQPGYDGRPLREWLEQCGVSWEIWSGKGQPWPSEQHLERLGTFGPEPLDSQGAGAESARRR